jgi:hypothetical protein
MLPVSRESITIRRPAVPPMHTHPDVVTDIQVRHAPLC